MEEYKIRYIQSYFEEVIDFLNDSLQHWDDKESTLETIITSVCSANKQTYDELLSGNVCESEIDLIKRKFIYTEISINNMIGKIYLDHPKWDDYEEKALLYFLKN